MESDEPPESPEEPPETPEQQPADTAPERKRRPRGRTTLLIASAALLGVVAGVATGYTVQAERKPTPLPPLSQPGLAYPEQRLSPEEFDPAPAKHDHRVKTDGDLRKLLVEKPEGTQDPTVRVSTDGWHKLFNYAQHYEEPGGMFENFGEWGLRRVAATGWDRGHRSVHIDLVQFSSSFQRSAWHHANGQIEYMSGEEWAGNDGHALKGPGKGRYFIYDEPYRKPGYLPQYKARAVAYRGDIMMNIRIWDSEPIDESDFRDLAQRQLERL